MKVRVKLILVGVEPEIWRLIELDSSLTLDRVHIALQVAMGWQDSHLHMLTEREPAFGADDPNFGPPRN